MSEPTKITLPDGGFLRAQFYSGPESAPVILLSNSVLTDMRIWDQQIAALNRFFPILSYDQRGHGLSSVSSTPMTFDDFGADVLTLLDAFDIHSCVFIGLSMGVPTGLAALRKSPQRFKAFVAVDGVAKSAAGREAFWSEQRKTARNVGLEQLTSEIAQRWLPSENETAVGILELTKILAGTPVEGFAAATHALQKYDYTSELIKLDVPFLAITGENDGAMPEAMRQQFNSVPRARFEIIKHAGHVPNFQRPDDFNEVLLNFLTSSDGLGFTSANPSTIDKKNTKTDELL